MKLFTKILFVVASIFAVLGILGVSIGLTMGASLKDLNEMGIYLSPHQQIRIRGNEIFWENDKKNIEEEKRKELEEKIENIEDNLEESAEEIEEIFEWEEENLRSGHHKIIQHH